MTSSTQALKLFSQDPSDFDLVITDQTMPELTGMRLASEPQRWRKSGQRPAGIKELLLKLLAKLELVETVRKVLDAEH
ncbi:MAG TPA: hypothetical protein VMT62_13535 [Syntrophorhabdaceae bacterium]|nr:hypothetical protein [Syntrophorhabdaceae bacterium]